MQQHTREEAVSSTGDKQLKEGKDEGDGGKPDRGRGSHHFQHKSSIPIPGYLTAT